VQPLLHIISLIPGLRAARIGNERGQTLAEYGILVAVIAIVVVATAIIFGGDLASLFSSNAHKL
jgi:Flp pilus assembly pilin Flp